MAPASRPTASASNWKELIDNGNLRQVIIKPVDGSNATNLPIDGGISQDVIRQQPQSPPSSSSAAWPAGSAVSLGGIDLLPVYCGLLGCLIIGLVAWILVKQTLRRANDGHDEKTLAVTSGEEHSSPPQQQQQPLMQQQLPLNSRNRQAGCRRPKRRSADSGFGGSELAAEDDFQQPAAELGGIYGGQRLLRELSDSRLQRLENILANDPDPDGWRRLAHELGLSQEEMSLLESHSVCGGNQPAIRQMLRTWCQRPTASVASLARCLRRVGRTDALILFRESPFLSSNSKASQQRLLERMHRRQQKERKSESDENLQQQQQQQQNDESLLLAAEPEIHLTTNNNSNAEATTVASHLLTVEQQEEDGQSQDKPVDLSTSSAVLFSDLD